MYFDVHIINIWEPQYTQNVSSYKQIELAGFMSPMSQRVWVKSSK